MTLSGRERTIAIVLSIVLGAAAFDYIVLSPMLAELSDAQARVDAAKASVAAADSAASDLIVARHKWSGIAGGSLLSTESAAQGQLLNKIAEYANASGVATGSIVPDRSAKEQDFQRISFRATVTGTMDQFARFLFALKSADIPLRVNDMTITPQREGQNDLSMQIGVSTIYVPPHVDAPLPSNGYTGNATNPPGGR